MRIDLQQSHAALPASAALEVAVLLKAEPDATTTTARAAAADSVHAGLVLDRSGSMEGGSGVSGLTKLEALKVAVQAALQLLEGCGATVTAAAFSDKARPLCHRLALAPRAAAGVAAAVEGLAAGGGTEAKAAMEPVLQALLPHDHTARRLVLVTDGEFNGGSVKPCRKLAQQAGEHGVALWVFGTGTSYNETYLRELVDLGAPGGMLVHITDLAALSQRLGDELRAVASATASGLAVVVTPSPGVRVLELTRLVPVQCAVALRPDGTAEDRMDVLDARGQAWVARLRADGLAAGRHALARWKVSHQENGQHHVQAFETALDVLPAGSAPSAANARVMTTVLSAHAAQATLLGNAALATQLYAAAGQTGLAQKLSALGTALPSSSDAARALRTEVLASTRLVALGSALPVKGGTP
ncbi:MAG: VWA domain-containing protein [Deltaproteobacteria bacterium]|nr:VWA domain-containing protein [Deltaproteobacteria bacterium]